MDEKYASVMEESIRAHALADDLDIARLRTLTTAERAALIEAACAAAAAVNRSRLAAGLPPAEPAHWPPSTWEFLRRNAANAGKK